MRGTLLRLLLTLGIAINIAFLLINLSPDRPHLARKQKIRVLVRASPWRAQWMKENLFDEFAGARDLEIELVPAKSFREVLELLRKEKQAPTGVLLADVNDEFADDLRRDGAVVPVERFVPPKDLAAAMREYLPEAVARASVDGKVWFVPKRALVDIVAYLRPAVEDLYLNWERDRSAIEAALREANGVGLPRGYELEKSPDSWDSFDLFVAGWYWAHHPAPWSSDGSQGLRPRLAFRTGLNEDALDDLFARFYRLGFEEKDLGRLDAQPVLDALQWDALFRKHHLLVRESESPEGVDAFPVNALLKGRAIAWAPIDQADSLWVHGGARRGAEPGMTSGVDLDWASFPSGASAALDAKTREPLRKGKSFSLTEVHLWAVPVHSPRPDLAWELARFVTQRGLQQRETEAVGLLPVREDLKQDYPILFRLDWMQRMLDASYRQIERGSGDMPDAVLDQGYDRIYTQLREAVLAGVPPVTLEGVRARVERFQAGLRAAEVRHAR